ncbi:hypothetical protein Bestia_00036 [Acinetobacter phage Bestia]|nr:hypothetical protein Mithridates_00040 [Acinetobacter phage Mithridates]QVG64269.1 hypothetical protein Bestia_00036 [Acinetobacter phage Bestia]
MTLLGFFILLMLNFCFIGMAISVSRNFKQFLYVMCVFIILEAIVLCGNF